MAAVARIVNRGDAFDDSKCANKWRWEWLSASTDTNKRLGDRFRKVNTNGVARCIVCNKDVSYANRGVATLLDHLRNLKYLYVCVSVESQHCV